MYPDHVKITKIINNTSENTLNISIIKQNLEFEHLLGHRRCKSTLIHIKIYVN